MDFEATIGNIWGFNKKTQYTPQWDGKQLWPIETYREYHQKMICLLSFSKEGPEGTILPYKPKTDLKFPLRKKQMFSKQVPGQDLHKYLIQRIIPRREDENWLTDGLNQKLVFKTYARKLPEVAKLLDKYPCFKTSNPFLSEVYPRTKLMQSMLITNHRVVQYWQ